MSENAYKRRWVSIDQPEEKFGEYVVANHWVARCRLDNFAADLTSKMYGGSLKEVTYTSPRNKGETDKEYVSRLKDGLALKVADMLRSSHPIA